MSNEDRDPIAVRAGEIGSRLRGYPDPDVDEAARLLLSVAEASRVRFDVAKQRVGNVLKFAESMQAGTRDEYEAQAEQILVGVFFMLGESRPNEAASRLIAQLKGAST